MRVRPSLVLAVISLLAVWLGTSILLYLNGTIMPPPLDVLRQLGWLALLSAYAVLVHGTMEKLRGRALAKVLPGRFLHTFLAAFILYASVHWIISTILYGVLLTLGKAEFGLVMGGSTMLFVRLGMEACLPFCLAATPGLNYRTGLGRMIRLMAWAPGLLLFLLLALPAIVSIDLGVYRWYLSLARDSLFMLPLLGAVPLLIRRRMHLGSRILVPSMPRDLPRHVRNDLKSLWPYALLTVAVLEILFHYGKLLPGTFPVLVALKILGYYILVGLGYLVWTQNLSPSPGARLRRLLLGGWKVAAIYLVVIVIYYVAMTGGALLFHTLFHYTPPLMSSMLRATLLALTFYILATILETGSLDGLQAVPHLLRRTWGLAVPLILATGLLETFFSCVYYQPYDGPNLPLAVAFSSGVNLLRCLLLMALVRAHRDHTGESKPLEG